MALTSFTTPIFFSQGFTSIKKLLSTADSGFKSNWENWSDMKWIGTEFWGNRLQEEKRFVMFPDQIEPCIFLPPSWELRTPIFSSQ